MDKPSTYALMLHANHCNAFRDFVIVHSVSKPDTGTQLSSYSK